MRSAVLMLLLIVSGNRLSAQPQAPNWTLDPAHDINCCLKKIKQEGLLVSNQTKVSVGLTMEFTPLSKVCPFEESYVVAPLGSLLLKDDGCYLKIIRAISKGNKDVAFTLKKEKDKYILLLTNEFLPLDELYGRDDFRFYFNLLKDDPLKQAPYVSYCEERSFDLLKESCLSHPLYTGSQKNHQEKTPSTCEQALKKDTSEGEDILFLKDYIKPYDRSNETRRQEKFFKNLLEKKRLYDEAPSQEKKIAFEALLKSKNDWKDWAKSYNGNVWFLENRILKEVNVDRKKYQEVLNFSYEKNNPSKMLDFYKTHSIQEQPFKIPPITHTLWFTHPDKPSEFPYQESLKQTSLVCPAAQGFEHYLWVLDKKLMPQTVEFFKDTDVKIRQIDEFGYFPLKNFVEEAVYKKKKMGLATDAFRACLLEALGGVYMDADFEAMMSLAPWLKFYDGVFSMEPMSTFIGNAHFMVSRNHPVMHECVNIIERNGFEETTPQYIQNVLKIDPAYATIAITGPGALTEAVSQKLSRGRRIDVVLPHPFFYPSVNNIYPELDVHKHVNNRFDLISWGLHKWDTNWVKQKFGSNG